MTVSACTLVVSMHTDHIILGLNSNEWQHGLAVSLTNDGPAASGHVGSCMHGLTRHPLLCMRAGRHVYATLTGFLLLYYPFGNGVFHLFVPSLLTYLAMHQIQEYSATLSWVISFAYLIAWCACRMPNALMLWACACRMHGALMPWIDWPSITCGVCSRETHAMDMVTTGLHAPAGMQCTLACIMRKRLA